jgi:hypothetical protein
MKLLKNIFAGLALVSFMASCSTTMPLTVTNNSIGTKVGVAKNNCLSYAPISFNSAMGDFYPASGGFCFNDKRYSLADAAKDGGISRIATVDLKMTNMILFYKYELIVTGE